MNDNLQKVTKCTHEAYLPNSIIKSKGKSAAAHRGWDLSNENVIIELSLLIPPLHHSETYLLLIGPLNRGVGSLEARFLIAVPVLLGDPIFCFSLSTESPSSGDDFFNWASSPETVTIHLTIELPWVTKKEFLLTISIQHQADKWWE